MKAADVMTRNVKTIRADAAVIDALRLMLDQNMSGMPVVDANGALVGMLTEGDFMRRSELDTERHHAAWLEFLLGPGRLAGEYVESHGRKVEEVMTPRVVSVAEDTPLAEVVQVMERRHIKRVPVLKDGHLAGIVSRADLLRAFVDVVKPGIDADTSDAAIRRCVIDEITRQPWNPQSTTTIRINKGVVDLDGIVLDERTREALRVLIENVPGVTQVRDHMTTIEPITGSIVFTPD